MVGVLLFLGVPVSYSMIIVALAGISYLHSVSASSSYIIKELVLNFSSYSLSVVPMFVFMGFVALKSGIGASLLEAVNKFIGHWRGGLAIAVQLACAMFGAICGSNTATVATIGTLAVPEMKKNHYADSFSTASVACGASLACLIPPSVQLVIYGIATETPIGRLFLAGILPGIVHMCIYIAAISIVLRFKPSIAPPAPKLSWKERFVAIPHSGVIEIGFVFCLSLGGLFLGWFTATEAGAIGAISLLVITLIEKKMNFIKIKEALLLTTSVTAMVFLLIAAATALGRFYALTRIPYTLGEFVEGLDLPGFAIFGVIILIYFVLGFVMDALGLILLTMPVFFPIVTSTLGYDPVWFGVIIVLIISMAAVTPPIGMNVYIISGVAKDVPLFTIFKGVWLFVVADLVMITSLLLFPVLATYLPSLL